MSRIGGLFRIDGAPIDPTLPGRVVAALAPGDADGSGVWTGGPVALVCSHQWTTPEASGSEQPVARIGARCRLVADARLDNRDDLIAQLQGHLVGPRPSDAALIVAAYSRWGVDCARHLTGDFAFALWDAERRRLLCLRDPIGVRQMYYRHEDRLFAVASNLRAVNVAFDRRPARHDALLQDLLAGRMDRWVHETAYRGVFRVPPGYRLIVDADGVRLERYYVLGERGQVRLRREDDYAEAFRAHLERAVRVRLRNQGGAGVLVSGGLSSSSVACIADRLAARGHEPARLYAATIDRASSSGDHESLAAIAAACPRLPLLRAPADDCWGLREFGTDLGYPLDEPELGVDRAFTLAPVRQARRDGCRVVLSGHGAEQLLSGDAYARPALLGDVAPGELRREAFHFSCGTGRSAMWLLSRALARPFMPAGLRRAIGRRPSTRSTGSGSMVSNVEPSTLLGTTLSWSSLDLAQDGPEALDGPKGRRQRRTWLAEPSAAAVPLPDALPPPTLATETARSVYRQLTGGLHSARLASHAAMAEHAGVEWRLPFLDLELVEFVLGLPAGLAFRDGQTSRLLRLAMSGVVPERIRQRRRSAQVSDLTEAGLTLHGRSRIMNCLVDPLTTRDRLTSYSTLLMAWTSYWDAPARHSCRPLVAFLSVEAWLRHFENDGIPIDAMEHMAAAV